MTIERVTSYSNDLQTSVNKLLPQLSKSRTTASPEELKELINGDGDILFAAIKDGEYVGFGILNIMRKFARIDAAINDIVVDESCRGQGMGGQILQALIDYAWSKNVTRIELTSNPDRTGAIRLYEKYGFKKRDTNLFRLTREE